MHLIFLAPDPEQFGPKKQKKHGIICITRLNQNPNFRRRLLHLKNFWLQLQPFKIAWALASAPEPCLFHKKLS